MWLLAISVFVWRIFALFNKLSRGVEVTDLKQILKDLLTQVAENKKWTGKLEERIGWLENDGKKHIQKVGLVRFNPFRELGGDHSFSLAVLDKDDSGVIITSLHTRDRTRVYMKEVKNGKSASDLSEEERKALSSAQRK